MADYFPDNDAEFLTWTQNFSSEITAAPTTFGLVAADATALAAQVTAFGTALSAHVAAQGAAQSATADKNSARMELENLVRSNVPQILINPGFVTGHLGVLGLPPRDEIRTAAPVPVSHPVLEILRMERLELTIGYRDAGSVNKARPAGVRGCEFFVKVGDPAPTSVSQCRYLGTDTRTPYLAVFEDSEVGETAHIIARWVNTRGEFGPISETLSITIPA